MLNTNLIQDLTKVYLISYNEALKETRNPSMAAQVAACVLMSYTQATVKPQETIDPISIITRAMVNAAKQKEQEETEDREENDGT